MGEQKINNYMRWKPGILIKPENFISFWQDYLKNTKRTICYVLGKGFDLRMNFILDKVIANHSGNNLSCLLIEYAEGENSPSHLFDDLVNTNIADLKKILKKKGTLSHKVVNMWEEDGYTKRRVSSLKASMVFENIEDIKDYSDIIIDISSLPRSIYISLIGKVLWLIDSLLNKEVNLFVVAAENAETDKLIEEIGIDESASTQHPFDGNLDRSSEQEIPIIWLPILGEGKKEQLEKVYKYLDPDEICPILPLPAKNPRRCDDLVLEYYDFLFNILQIEKQNIIYAAEQNPFSVYEQIQKSFKSYQKSLSSIGGCKMALSTFSSKLLSLGALLASYELFIQNEKDVSIVNIESQGYNIIDRKRISRSAKNNELFALWLTGQPYETS